MKTTIEMALEANLVCAVDDPVSPWPEIHDLTNELKVFEAIVRADEREAAQAEHEADKVIIEYHEATIKRLEAELKARGNT
jgi:hypothetical protein